MNVFQPCRDPPPQRCFDEAHEPTASSADRNPSNVVIKDSSITTDNMEPNHKYPLAIKRDPSFEDICQAAENLITSSGFGQGNQWNKSQEYLGRQPCLSFSIEHIKRVTVEQHVSKNSLSGPRADNMKKTVTEAKPNDFQLDKFKRCSDKTQSCKDKSPRRMSEACNSCESVAAPRSGSKISKPSNSQLLFPCVKDSFEHSTGTPRLIDEACSKYQSSSLSPPHEADSKKKSQKFSACNKLNTIASNKTSPFKYHSNSVQSSDNLIDVDSEKRNSFPFCRSQSRSKCSPSHGKSSRDPCENDFMKNQKTACRSLIKQSSGIFYHQTSPSSSSSRLGHKKNQKVTKTYENATCYIANQTKRDTLDASSSRCSSPGFLMKSKSLDVSDLSRKKSPQTFSRPSKECLPKQSTTDRSIRSIGHISNSHHSRHKDNCSPGSWCKKRQTSKVDDSQKIQKPITKKSPTSFSSCLSALSVTLSPSNTDLDCTWSRSCGQPASPCLFCCSPDIDKQIVNESICERYWRELEECSPMFSLSVSPVSSNIPEIDGVVDSYRHSSCPCSTRSNSAESVNSGEAYKSLNQSKSSNKCPVTCCCSQCIDLYVKKRHDKNRESANQPTFGEGPSLMGENVVKKREGELPYDDIREIWLKLYSTSPEMTGFKRGISFEVPIKAEENRHSERQTHKGRKTRSKKAVMQQPTSEIRDKIRPKRRRKKDKETQAEEKKTKELGGYCMRCAGHTMNELKECDCFYESKHKDYQHCYPKCCKRQSGRKCYKQCCQNHKCERCAPKSLQQQYPNQVDRHAILKCCCKSQVKCVECFQKPHNGHLECPVCNLEFSDIQPHHCLHSSGSSSKKCPCKKNDVKQKHWHSCVEDPILSEKSSTSQSSSPSLTNVVCTECSHRIPHLSTVTFHQNKSVSENERLEKIMQLCSGILSEYINTYNNLKTKDIGNTKHPKQQKTRKNSPDTVSKDGGRGLKRKKHCKSVQTSKCRSSSSGSSSFCSSEAIKAISKFPHFVESADTWPKLKHGKKKSIRKQKNDCFSSPASTSSEGLRGSTAKKHKKRRHLKKRSLSRHETNKRKDSNTQFSSISYSSSIDRCSISSKRSSEELLFSEAQKTTKKAKHNRLKSIVRKILKHKRLENKRRMTDALSNQTHRLLQLEQNIDHNIMETICRPQRYKIQPLSSPIQSYPMPICNMVHSDRCLTREYKRGHRNIFKDYSPNTTRSLGKQNKTGLEYLTKRCKALERKTEETTRAFDFSKHDTYLTLNRHTQNKSSPYYRKPVTNRGCTSRTPCPHSTRCRKRKSPSPSRYTLMSSKPSSYTSLPKPIFRAREITPCKARTSAAYINAHANSDDKRRIYNQGSRGSSLLTSFTKHLGLPSWRFCPHKNDQPFPSHLSLVYFERGEKKAAQHSGTLFSGAASRQRELDAQERKPKFQTQDHCDEARLTSDGHLGEASILTPIEIISPREKQTFENETLKETQHSSEHQQASLMPDLSAGEIKLSGEGEMDALAKPDSVLDNTFQVSSVRTIPVAEQITTENVLQNQSSVEKCVEKKISNIKPSAEEQNVEIQKDSSSNKWVSINRTSMRPQKTKLLVAKSKSRKPKILLPEKEENGCQIIDLTEGETNLIM